MAAAKFYETAFALGKSALWKKLPPDAVFAVHSSSGKTLWCTVDGEAKILRIWPGQKGLDSLRSGDPQQSCCLMLVYRSLISLTEDELRGVTACADRMKLTLRGANPCPRFMKQEPWYLPVRTTDRGELSLILEAMSAAAYAGELLKKYSVEALGILPGELAPGALIPCVE